MTDLIDRVYWRLLVIRCQIGDREAFEELVARCQPRLGGFLRKMLGGVDQVDDVGQDVWMDVYQDLGKLENPEAAQFSPTRST